MDFWNGRLGRYARERLRQRRGWALLGIAIFGWLVLIAVGYGVWWLTQGL